MRRVDGLVDAVPHGPGSRITAKSQPECIDLSGKDQFLCAGELGWNLAPIWHPETSVSGLVSSRAKSLWS